jgi:exodeoxyribonuclease III
MRILTWNVNGLRAILRKDVWRQVVALDPDIICLQEIKTRPEQLSIQENAFVHGYQVVWNPAERPGYSGVATLFRIIPRAIVLGIGDTKFDTEGRIIQSHYEKFILFNIYFPNGQRDQGRLAYKLDFYATLLEYCNKLRSLGNEVVLCGDFNTAHNEIDLKNPKSNQTTSGFLPEERLWIDRYLENGFVDIFRYLYPDRIQYTWWTYISNARARNVGWRLDYFLTTDNLVPVVRASTIHDEIMGSDHCPVSLEITVDSTS